MEFRKDTPTVGNLIKIVCKNLIFEASITGRSLALDCGDEELSLSNGAVAHRTRDSCNWRIWLSKDDIGKIKAMTSVELTVIS